MSGVNLKRDDLHGGAGMALSPPNHKFVVIFMHGLGDEASGWIDLAHALSRRQGNFLDTRFILPTAQIQPVTLNGGIPMRAWSDIIGLTPDDREDEKGLWVSQKRIASIIDAEIKSGIDPRNIIVGGFSQGGAIAYLTGLTYPQTLGGIVVLSSWCPLVANNGSGDSALQTPLEVHAATTATPVFHGHGTIDEIVRFDWGRKAANFLRDTHKMNVTFKQYHMGHTAVDEEFIDVGDFIQNIFERREIESQTDTTTTSTTEISETAGEQEV